MVGDKIRTFRKEQGMSLSELAARTGVSDSYISQLECNSMDPSISILRRISQELGIPISAFFDEDCPDPVCVRAHAADEMMVSKDGISYQYLSPAETDFSGKLTMLFFQIPSGKETAFRQSPRETCIFLQSGTLLVSLEGRSYQMQPGDSMNIRKNIPYRLTNNGETPASGIAGMAGGMKEESGKTVDIGKEEQE